MLYRLGMNKMNIKTEYKYITFIPIDNPGKKTMKYNCTNTKSGDVLGVIQWYNHWRQYCYFPTCSAVYSTGCLNDIIDFINQLKK